MIRPQLLNRSTFAAGLIALTFAVALSNRCQADSTPPPTPAPEIDFVKDTGFTYGAWHSGIIGGGGFDQNVVACPTNPNRFYTYVDVGGCFRSDDGGHSWRMLHGHLPANGGNTGVRGLIVDPRDDKRILIATGGAWSPTQGVFLSTDAGATFKNVLPAKYDGNGAARDAGFILTRDPNNPDVIATGTIKGGVFISRDDGETWTASGATGLYPCDLRFDRSNSNRLWLCACGAKMNGTDYTSGFYRSDDGGATWNQIPGPAPSELLQDPKDPTILYGIFQSAIIRKSTDGGSTWVDWSNGLNLEPLKPGESKESISKTAYRALAAGPDFILTCNTRDADFFKLPAGGDTWQPVTRNPPDVGDWYNKGGWTFGGSAGSVTVDPHDANHWFMTDFFAIYQTWDGGHNWRLTVDGLETTVSHCLLQDPSDPGVIHVGLADVGNFNSVNGGARFHKAKVPDNPENRDDLAGGGNMKCIDLCPKLPNRLYAVSNNNCYVLWRADRVFISTDRGETWYRSPEVGLPDTAKQPCTTITCDLNDPYTVYLTAAGKVGPNDGGVYKSIDGGARWTQMSDGLPTGSWYFPFDIWAHGRQLAAGPDGSLIAISKQQNLVYRYDPAAKTWVSAAFPHGGELWSVAADRLKPGRYFVGCRDDGLYRTEDDGVTWKKVYAGSVSFVATDAATPDREAGGTFDGIIVSTNGGDTWTTMDKELPNRNDAIPAFAGDRLFAATGGNGVFWMPLTPAASAPVTAKPLIPATPPLQAALPPLQNTDFQTDGDPVPGWTLQTDSGSVTPAHDTKLVPKDAAASLQLSTGEAAASATLYQEWPVSLWQFVVGGVERSSGDFSKIQVQLQPFDAANQPLEPIQLASFKANNAWWDGLHKTVTLPATATKARLAIHFEGTGKVWLDQFSIKAPQALFPQ